MVQSATIVNLGTELKAIEGRKTVNRRLSHILERIAAGERVRVEDLIKGMGMSAATIRRDLRRLQGGALSAATK